MCTRGLASSSERDVEGFEIGGGGEGILYGCYICFTYRNTTSLATFSTSLGIGTYKADTLPADPATNRGYK
jgi:hypothetical protein